MSKKKKYTTNLHKNNPNIHNFGWQTYESNTDEVITVSGLILENGATYNVDSTKKHYLVDEEYLALLLNGEKAPQQSMSKTVKNKFTELEDRLDALENKE